jgi:hypothetical protein
MTQQYEIRLPEGLRLMVSITGNPIDFDIVFPDNRAVNFKDIPGKGPSITPMDGLHQQVTDEPKVPGQKPARRTTVSQSSAARPTISYAMNTDGTVPMQPRTFIVAAP